MGDFRHAPSQDRSPLKDRGNGVGTSFAPFALGPVLCADGGKEAVLVASWRSRRSNANRFLNYLSIHLLRQHLTPLYRHAGAVLFVDGSTGKRTVAIKEIVERGQDR